MATRKVDEAQLLEALTDVFRRHGFEGASLARIAEATGLQKASLYHRFPAGKLAMAEAVLDRMDVRFKDDVLAPLSDPGNPAERVRGMVERLKVFYADGHKSCMTDTLSIGDVDLVGKHVRESLAAWRDALVKIAREAGMSTVTAKRRAEQALVRIQGALVLVRVTGDTSVFRRELDELPALLTEK